MSFFSFYVPALSIIVAVGGSFVMVAISMLYAISKIRKNNVVDEDDLSLDDDSEGTDAEATSSEDAEMAAEDAAAYAAAEKAAKDKEPFGSI